MFTAFAAKTLPLHCWRSDAAGCSGSPLRCTATSSRCPLRCARSVAIQCTHTLPHPHPHTRSHAHTHTRTHALALIHKQTPARIFARLQPIRHHVLVCVCVRSIRVCVLARVCSISRNVECTDTPPACALAAERVRFLRAGRSKRNAPLTSAAPPSTFGRCINSDGEGTSAN